MIGTMHRLSLVGAVIGYSKLWPIIYQVSVVGSLTDNLHFRHCWKNLACPLNVFVQRYLMQWSITSMYLTPRADSGEIGHLSAQIGHPVKGTQGVALEWL